MTTPPPRLALGVDIGGTSTRALVVGMDGVRYGFGTGPGANVTSHALEHALDAISTALGDALHDVDPRQVVAAVVGAAGDNNLRVPQIAAALDERWRRAGLWCPCDVRADALVAFLAGTSASEGTLVLSGTGSLIARVEERELAQIVDGHGWLLGDLGSGFWLGREAVRAALAALDRQNSPGPLGRGVVEALLGGIRPGRRPRDIAADLVLQVHGRKPVQLSELAPLVSQHAHDDPEAARILDEAADHLLRAVGIVRPPEATSPIVLAGSLLTTATPLAQLVRPRLAALWPSASLCTASDATAGAAWLAAVQGDAMDEDAAIELHRILLPEAHAAPAGR